MFEKMHYMLEQEMGDVEASRRDIREAFDDALARQIDWTSSHQGGMEGRSRAPEYA